MIILTGLLFCFTGCRTSDDFNYIENSIRDQIYPAKLDKDIKFSLGSLSIRMINGFIDDEEKADELLKEIKSVQVGVYKVRDIEKTGAFRISSDVERSMVKKGWDPFVHVRERNGEDVSLYFRQLSEIK